MTDFFLRLNLSGSLKSLLATSRVLEATYIVKIIHNYLCI